MRRRIEKEPEKIAEIARSVLLAALLIMLGAIVALALSGALRLWLALAGLALGLGVVILAFRLPPGP